MAMKQQPWMKISLLLKQNYVIFQLYRTMWVDQLILEFLEDSLRLAGELLSTMKLIRDLDIFGDQRAGWKNKKTQKTSPSPGVFFSCLFFLVGDEISEPVFCGDYFINDEIRIPIKQPVYNGERWVLCLLSLLRVVHLTQWPTCILAFQDYIFRYI